MNRSWRLWFPLYIATLPLSLIALLYAVVIARASSWRWIDGCLTFVAATKVRGGATVSCMWGNPGGQCWSPVVGFASELQRARTDLRAHEYTHVAQCFLGVLVGLALFPPLLVAMGWPLWLAPAFAWLVFPIVYGIGFFVPFALGGFRDWRAAYMASPIERHAYGIQADYLKMPTTKQLGVWGHRS